MDKFPLNYFSSLRSPKQLFLGRKQLTWPKFIVIFLFLISFMVMPITLFYTNQVSAIPMEQFLSVNTLIDQEGVARLRELQLTNGRLTADSEIISVTNDVIIGTALTTEEMAERGAAINFEETSWTIRQEEDGQTREYNMSYPSSFDFMRITSPKEFEQFLENEFYASNRPMIILSYSLTLGILLFIMTGLILFGAAFFLWLTRKSKFSSIKNFKESANLMLNVLGVSSIIAGFVGFIHFDFVLMMGIQSTIAVLLLLWIFAKTGFKDSKAIQV